MFSQANFQGIKSKMKNRKVVTIIQIVSLRMSCSRKFDKRAECSKTKWADNDVHSISEVYFFRVKLIFAEKGNLKFSGAKMRWTEESEKFSLS